ncbi:RNA-directed DNA polymerase from mobile element jockey [Trichonephila clavipes]|nr:RNA-directed DNA polymerase from mobile element jockey [Trichonephila clavipes]
MFNNCRGPGSVHTQDSIVLGVINLLKCKGLLSLISEKESLRVLTCGPSQKLSASSDPYELVFLFSEAELFAIFIYVGFLTRMFAVYGVPVSAADKECRVYPLDPRPDDVALYSGRTPASLGVISEPDLLCTSETEILERFSDRGVVQVRRITLDADIIPTKHIILTFNSLQHPTTIKVGYFNCKIRPYIPNPSARDSDTLVLLAVVN